jgi:hypothetical protein
MIRCKRKEDLALLGKALNLLIFSGACFPLFACTKTEARGGVFACLSNKGKEVAFLYDEKADTIRVLNVGDGVGENGFYASKRGSIIGWHISNDKTLTSFILTQSTMKMKVVSADDVSASNPFGSNRKTTYHMCRWVGNSWQSFR